MTFSSRSALALLWLSIALLATPAWAQGGDDVAERAQNAKTKEEFSEILEAFERTNSGKTWIVTVRNSLAYGLETAKREFVSNYRADEIRSAPEVNGKVADPDREAREILSSPAYRDAGTTESNNWIGKAMASVGEWLATMLRDLLSQLRPPDRGLSMPNMSGGALAARAFMIILGVALVGFVVFFAFKVSRGRILRRKAGGLLDDDEPDRTADEWLAQADLLTGQGKYREAVRCLYIACLVRFDDAGVAAFDRGQTNWEHLHRISVSPKKPPGMDFRPATKSFDLFWYGYAPINADDVAEFRVLYDRLLHDLGMRAAA
jgi:hypothetical protein